MILALGFLTTAIFVGFLLTYTLRLRLSLPERLCYGTVGGLVTLLWIVFLLGLLLGLRQPVIVGTMLGACAAGMGLLGRTSRWRTRLLEEARAWRQQVIAAPCRFLLDLAVFVPLIVILHRFFATVLYTKADGLYTLVAYNYGDLPLHLSYITSMAWGDNFPPDNPIYAGRPLRYPIMADFLTAILVTLGLGLGAALYLCGMLLALAFFGLLTCFTARLTGCSPAAKVVSYLFLFHGGFGFWYFFTDLWERREGVWALLQKPLRDYTSVDSLGIVWKNPFLTLFIPQRNFLFAFSLGLLIFLLLWRGIAHPRGSDLSGRSARDFLAAGLLCGSLPLFHAHTYAAVLMVAMPMAMLGVSRTWLHFFLPALLLALPQLWYLTGDSGGLGFLRVQWGWMAHGENIALFWLKNLGIVPLLVLGLLVSPLVSAQQRTFYLPFLVPFLVGNAVILAPWEWDNSKVLIWWLMGSLPFVSLALVRLPRLIKPQIEAWLLTIGVAGLLTCAGALDIWKHGRPNNPGVREFANEQVTCAEALKESTEPRAVFLTQPTYNHPVFLAGRKTLMGYPGHLWTHGIDAAQRERDVRVMLKGRERAQALLETYKVDYVYIGEQELAGGAHKAFFDQNYPRLLSCSGISVYKVR